MRPWKIFTISLKMTSQMLIFRGKAKNLCCMLNDALQSEERDAQQKAKIDWIKLGDNNTRIFHAQTRKREKNIIKALEKDDDTMIFSRKEIQKKNNLLSKALDRQTRGMTTGYLNPIKCWLHKPRLSYCLIHR